MALYQRSSKMAKVNISESIVATTRKQNGRFLEKQQHDAKTTATGETALRFDIVGVRAIQKTPHALRDASSRKRQQQQQQQSQGKRRRHQQSALNSTATISATIHPLEASVQQPYKEKKKKNKHNKLVPWEERRKQLENYKNTVGDTNVPQHYKKNKQLGTWVDRQRSQYKLLKQGKSSSTMTEERIRSLNELEFDWRYKKQGAWNERRKQLDNYKTAVGDTNVPWGYGKNKQLATWVKTQRGQYRLLKQGKSSSMTEERIRSLNELEFDWRYKKQGAKKHGKPVSWDERWKQLANYKTAVGDTNVPQDYEENKQLGIWVKTQRRQYSLLKQGKSSSMTEERIRSLNELEFNWQPVSWNERRTQLDNYKATVGDTNVPQDYEENKQLGIWVKTQRRQYSLLKQGKSSSMTEERIRSLNELEFNWQLNTKRAIKKATDTESDLASSEL